ncbi:hypothetical protein [Alicyclobacillus fodiniaquatilis]|uniref:Uncharacterized protein n=1 Tax=Alicyclobacillus fodiniaquatilis TaxID=1661150 RepID=A0ABW4JL53_9BACL
MQHTIIVAGAFVLAMVGVVGCSASTQGSIHLAAQNSTTNTTADSNNTSLKNTTSMMTNNDSTTKNTTATNTTSTETPNNTTTTSTTKTGGNGATTVSSATDSVYVFSQATLEEMYAALYVRTVGPVVIPSNVSQNALSYAPKVSLKMLQYAPASEQSLDQQLIQQIQNWNNHKEMKLLPSLPGYQLNFYSHPTGSPMHFWDTKNWPQWTSPVLK